ncbi:lysylphosphatidylglycerol synthase transmembrane domain-containing protein [Nitrospira sp. M1]
MSSSRVWVVLRLLVSFGLLAYVVSSANWGKIIHTLDNARVFDLLIFLALTPMSVYLCTLKWKILLDVRGAHVPTGRLFGLYITGMFYNHIFPSSIGGDVVRVTALKQHVPSLQDALGSVFVERLTGFFILTLLGLGALLSWPGLRSHSLVMGIIMVSVVVHVALAFAIVDRRLISLLERLFGWSPFASKILDKLEKIRTYLDRYRANPGVLAQCLMLSLFFYVISILNVYLVARGIGDWIPFGKCAVAMPITQLVSMLPIAINGIGLTEWAFTYTFSELGQSASTGLAVALIIRVRNMLWAALGYGLLTAIGTMRKLSSEQS